MTGIYHNFAELAENEEESVDFNIDVRSARSRFAIVAPHGGCIEHGTSQIVRGIAGNNHAFYCFEGLKDPSHRLHISSNRFDEPRALAIVGSVDVVITIHGAYGKTPHVYFGGLHEELKMSFIDELTQEGFAADHDPSPTRQGKGKTNICNRGREGKGVQIEMTQGFRKSLFHKPDYQHKNWRPNEDYTRVCECD